MEITINSNEPLDHVLRVLGAAYGVELAPASAGQAADKRVSGRRNGSRGTRARTRRGGARRSAARQPSTKDVRFWAREQGIAVSDRGRIPASVVSAYQDAHQS